MVKRAERVWSVGAVALAGLVVWGAQARAANPTPADAGKMYFGQYCAKCHGESGKGDGPQAATLGAKMPDLTQLAKSHGGKFPYMEVLDIVDGANPLPSHGGKEMPAWGQTFQSDGSADPMQQAAVRGKLMLLTDYLRSIQAK